MKKSNNVVKSFTMITQFTINMLVPIGLCTFVGIGLDKLFSTSFIVVILFFIGALAGFTNIFRLARGIYDQPNPDHINYYSIDGNHIQQDSTEDKEEVPDDSNALEGK